MIHPTGQQFETEELRRISTVLYWPEVAVILNGEDGPPGGIVPWPEVSKRAAHVVFASDLLQGAGNLRVTQVGLFIWDTAGLVYETNADRPDSSPGPHHARMREGLAYWEKLVLLYTVLRLFIQNRAKDTKSERAARWTTVCADDFVDASDTRPIVGVSGESTALARRKFDLYAVRPLHIPTPSLRNLLEVSVIEAAVSDLENELAKPDSRQRLQVLRLHHDACAAYAARDFTGSLVTGFPAVEALIEQWWKDVAPSNADADLDSLVGKPLRKRLHKAQRSSAGPGVALQAELLSAANVLLQAQYGFITTARRARNEWVHEMKPAPYIAAEASMDALAFLIQERLGHEVSTPGGFQY